MSEKQEALVKPKPRIRFVHDSEIFSEEPQALNYRNYLPRFPQRKRIPYLKNERNNKFRLARQITVSILIFLMVWGLNSLHFPLAKKVGSGVKYLLNKEMDFSPVINKIGELASPYLNFTLPNGKNTVNEEPKPVITKISDQIGPQLPVGGKITVPYGWVFDDSKQFFEFHRGIDIVAKANQDIKAVAGGNIERIYMGDKGEKCILVRHDEQLMTNYVNVGEVLVEKGEEIHAGQVIGKVAGDGEDKENHLHFEVIRFGKPVDPFSVFTAATR
ncbi:peptidase M23 [Thermincola ferriacetica]|uniref:Peptidase M23 n=1 Tax=Thermincola ferriacetica TaxID=281456 RepID=A0A0L6W398_9FIRM|nr:M23 family metallopeptidase [Thermincola ferriacetica]KNZ69559.1 peptidase M23 [Thermincola ferriacetica]